MPHRPELPPARCRRCNRGKEHVSYTMYHALSSLYRYHLYRNYLHWPDNSLAHLLLPSPSAATVTMMG